MSYGIVSAFRVKYDSIKPKIPFSMSFFIVIVSKSFAAFRKQLSRIKLRINLNLNKL